MNVANDAAVFLELKGVDVIVTKFVFLPIVFAFCWFAH